MSEDEPGSRSEPEPDDRNNKDETGDQPEKTTAAEESDEPSPDQTINVVLNAFYDAVNAERAVLGVSTTGIAGAVSATGRLD
jgi:hypothetical protein